MANLAHNKSAHCFTLAGVLLAHSCLAVHSLADQILVQSNDGSGRTFQLQGKVLNYTGKELVLETVAGNKRAIPSLRVLEIRSDRESAEKLGDAALANHDWRTAAGHFQIAANAEIRPWVRRLILTKLLESRRNLGQHQAAGDLFLRLVKDDPQTPAYRHMPLAWTSAEAVQSEQAHQWLAQTNAPAAVVLGASHLLSTKDRPVAVGALSRLHRQLLEHPELAAMAEAQSWRAIQTPLTPTMVDRWARRAEAFPEIVRAGPYFVVAKNYQRLEQSDRATLYYMRVAVLYPEQRHLASRALTAAARLADRAGHTDETRSLLEEVVARYEDTPERALAEQQLKDLVPADPPFSR